jgi:CTP:molybdopterin cytidylyltransferase MocA
MVAWVVDLVDRLPLDERVIVLGAEADAIREALFPPDRLSPGVASPMRDRPASPTRMGGDEGERRPWRIVLNEDWAEGLGSSLRRAAEEVDGGMLVFLGDMPWVPVEGAQAVLAQAGDRPVAPAYRGQRGFPVYLPPQLRPRLHMLDGDSGAREFLANCELIPWDDPGVIRDVDVAEDLHGA